MAPSWGPQQPYSFPSHQPPSRPQGSGALAIVSFIASLVAFLCGWVPFLGIGLGILGLVLALFAMRTPVLRGLAVAGIILSTLATITSLVTSGLFVLAIAGSESSTESPQSAASHSAEDFVEVDDRTLASIAKDPASHEGATLTIYGYVSQFDSDTGRCTMRVSVSAAQRASWIDYEHNSLAYSGDGEDDCPALDQVVAEDVVKMNVVLQGGKSYNTLGGSTTVPYFEVIDIQVL